MKERKLMMTAKLSKQNQLTLPKGARDILHTVPGDTLAFVQDGKNCVKVYKKQNDLDALFGSLEGCFDSKVTDEDIEEVKRNRGN